MLVSFRYSLWENTNSCDKTKLRETPKAINTKIIQK